ncbi:hypothetical protein GCM10011608_59090 [Micromonospora sonchi]|uniref:Aminotransferase class V domain-containing protein n=1 Tax=Micromonospora sonchi TaxID=1763543 RepID=A0A917U8A3_9ACTN|nr:hypothetical protein GCM10011608_59090 [Micromonospora sonchi]
MALAHLDPYDNAVTSVGARLVPVGYPSSCHADELDRAIGPATAAVLFRPGRPGNLLPLADTCEIAHRHGVPVIVDGALHVPPVDRLTGFLAAGADLVAVSGGKGLRGPQASGLLCGRADLIAAVALHHQDMDERSATWRPPARGRRPDPPRHGVGRPMKVGREQVMGLLAAVERYLAEPGRDEEPGIAELAVAEAALRAVPALDVRREHEPALDVPVLHVHVGRAGVAVDDVVHRLADGGGEIPRLRRHRPTQRPQADPWPTQRQRSGGSEGAPVGDPGQMLPIPPARPTRAPHPDHQPRRLHHRRDLRG